MTDRIARIDGKQGRVARTRRTGLPKYANYMCNNGESKLFRGELFPQRKHVSRIFSTEFYANSRIVSTNMKREILSYTFEKLLENLKVSLLIC
jgi:hypothetical protein